MTGKREPRIAQRAFFGSRAPDAPDAGTAVQRAADAYRGFTAPFVRRPGAWITIAIVVAVSTSAEGRVATGIVAGFATLFATYCLLNFWRCREPHCVVTGFGWTAVAIAGVAATIIGGSVARWLWVAFAFVWVVGMAYEARKPRLALGRASDRGLASRGGPSSRR